MKFMIIMHMNPAVWDALPEEGRQAVMDGHGPLLKDITESGELVSTNALGDPSISSVVRVRDGVPVVTDGPFAEAKEFLAGFYLVDVDSKERALELAARVPDASVEGLGVEVRPVMFSAGGDV